jgi:hypothetical protein
LRIYAQLLLKRLGPELGNVLALADSAERRSTRTEVADRHQPAHLIQN